MASTPKTVKRESPRLRARSLAVNRLILAHHEEYETLLKAAHEQIGVEYVRTVTPEEKAETKRLAAIEKARKAREAADAELKALGFEEQEPAVVA